jgi:hypothetical protein
VRRTFFAVVGFWLAVVTMVGLKSTTFAKTMGWVEEVPYAPDLPPADGLDGGASGTVAPSVAATASIPGPGATLDPSGAPTSGPAAPPPTGGGGGSAPPPPPPPASATFTGASIDVRTAQSPTTKSQPCGDCASYAISVTITVSSGRITATSVAYSRSPGESQTYASSANNKLKSSILTAQTWNLGRVSGATYSGNAWELSVRDAMSKAGLPV